MKQNNTDQKKIMPAVSLIVVVTLISFQKSVIRINVHFDFLLESVLYVSRKLLTTRFICICYIKYKMEINNTFIILYIG